MMFSCDRRAEPTIAAFVVALFGLFVQELSAEPIEKTRYGRAVLRIEGRDMPKESPIEAIEKLEPALAKAGVQARWIQVVNNGGSPMVENPFLPCPYNAETAAANEKVLERWVEEIHKAGMPALSWFSLSYCAKGNERHPDWRQVSILPWPHAGAEHGPCCINSPYGDALIAYCNWAIKRFKLDGLWFDGSFWSPLWETPLPLTCRCAACQKKFKEAKGLEIPEKIDWENPAFRAWLAWRYKSYGSYVGRMSDAIRKENPQAAIAINHYHRPGSPWHGAVPLDKYAADIITGSEAYTAEDVDLTMRLCRAYGRSQSEVWRQFDVGPNLQTGVEHLLEHALVCYAAGGQPSYGYDTFHGEDDNAIAAAAMMTPIMGAIHPYVSNNSLPYCAMHVSQQTETFFFGPVQGRPWDDDPYFERDPYFSALMNWSEGLGMAHMPPDYVYDANFTPASLARYKLLLMPLSMALGDDQIETAVEYVRSGGTLLLGPGAGQCDGQGLPRSNNPLADAFGFSFDGPVPSIVEKLDVASMVETAGRTTSVRADRRTKLHLTAPDWSVLCREGKASDAPPAVASRPFGKGHVMVMSFDGVHLLGSMPAKGGDTGLETTDETAAAGKRSLRFTDGPKSPQPYYPDLEVPIASFDSPDYLGGTLEFDMKVDENSAVVVDVRSNAARGANPRLAIQPNGKLVLDGKAAGEVPCGQWFHAAISCDFARDGKPSTYQVTIALADGRKIESPQIATPAADYRRTDRIVIFGPGTSSTTFYLDNLELSARKADGSSDVVYREDFETGPDSLVAPRQLTSRVVEMLGQTAPPPIAIQASWEVRTGVFEAEDGRVYVHLHDRAARRGDWQQASGPEVVLRGSMPISQAKLAISGRSLEIRRQGDRWEIPVPPIGLYQVIELKR